MFGAETARRRVVQRRNGGAEMALPRDFQSVLLPLGMSFYQLQEFFILSINFSNKPVIMILNYVKVKKTEETTKIQEL